ncbi:unnamed protein product [Heterobilharzia americana]|nr:unnamed protein product [Heterobilharzia americana]
MVLKPENYLLNSSKLPVFQKQQLLLLQEGSRVSYPIGSDVCQIPGHPTTRTNSHQQQIIPWGGDYPVNQSNELLEVKSETAKINNEMLRKFQQSRRHSRRPTIQMEFNLGDLCSALKQLMLKIAKKDEIGQRDREWRLVLMTIDRLFSWFYSTVVIVAGIYLLFPRGRSHTVQEIIAMHQEKYDIRNQAVARQCMMGYSKTI